MVEDQVTYPLTTAMLSVPKSKVVRGFSFFGASFVYIISRTAPTSTGRARGAGIPQLRGRPPCRGRDPALGPTPPASAGSISTRCWPGQDARRTAHAPGLVSALPADQGHGVAEVARSAASCRPTRSPSIR